MERKKYILGDRRLALLKHNGHVKLLSRRQQDKAVTEISSGQAYLFNSEVERDFIPNLQKWVEIRRLLNYDVITLNKILSESTDIHLESAQSPPQFGERILLLILSKDQRINIPGDLAEEYVEIAELQGVRFAKLWYYKQVLASAWPIIWKALRWGIWVSVGTWIRRII